MDVSDPEIVKGVEPKVLFAVKSGIVLSILTLTSVEQVIVRVEWSHVLLNMRSVEVPFN